MWREKKKYCRNAGAISTAGMLVSCKLLCQETSTLPLACFFFRCPSFDDLPPDCTLAADPDDPCCLKPKCVPGLLSGTTLAPIPNLIPTLAPGKIVGTAVYPTPTPGPNGGTPGISETGTLLFLGEEFSCTALTCSDSCVVRHV